MRGFLFGPVCPIYGVGAVNSAKYGEKFLALIRDCDAGQSKAV